MNKHLALVLIICLCAIVTTRAQSVMDLYPEIVHNRMGDFLLENGFHKVSIKNSSTMETVEERYYEEGKIIKVLFYYSEVQMSSSFGGIVNYEGILKDKEIRYYYDTKRRLIAERKTVELDGVVKRDSISYIYADNKLVRKEHLFSSISVFRCSYDYQIVNSVDYYYEEERLIREEESKSFLCFTDMTDIKTCSIDYEWINDNECHKVYSWFDGDEITTSSKETLKYDDQGNLILSYWGGHDSDVEENWDRYSYAKTNVITIENSREGRDPKQIKEKLFFDQQGRLSHIQCSIGEQYVFLYE
ncbi:hypothetical protein [Lewinella sp. LCG006]|uniref:hypothetical protein n=1 Tax=Lewinella sp. LCG006 TaxID=3231911 RepID=UPI0034600760